MKKALSLIATVALLTSVSMAQPRSATSSAQKAHRFDNTLPTQQVKKGTPMASQHQATSITPQGIAKSLGDTISTFPWNEGFENGTTGWTIVENDGDGICWQLSSTCNQTNFTGYPRTGNNCIVAFSFDNLNEEALTPDEWLISPALVIPTDAEYTLTFYDNGTDDDYAAEHYAIHVGTSNSVAALGATTPVMEQTLEEAEWVKRTVDLSAYAGQTIYIGFHHYNCSDMFCLGIDDIRVGEIEAPEVSLAGPTMAIAGNPVTFTASGASTFSWFVDGIQQTGTNATFTYTFTTTGSYTVKASATNVSGTGSDSIIVNVIECNTESIPFTADFSYGITECWDNSNNTDGYGWDTVTIDSTTYIYSMSAIDFYGIFIIDNDADNWLITPTLNIATPGEYQVQWNAREYTPDYSTDHYSVYLIDGNDQTTLLFDETLNADAAENVQPRAVSLPNTLSGDFRIAFRHYESTGGYVLMLSDIYVGGLTAPIVTISGPTDVRAGVATTFTANSGTATSYAWTVDGNAQTGTGNTLTYTFTTAGTHTVSVVATNSIGSSQPTTMSLNVYSCDAISTFPWEEDFEDPNTLSCWEFNTLSDDEGFIAYYGYLVGNYNDYSDVNAWAITPAISLPVGSNYELSWQVSLNPWEGIPNTYSVMISTTGTDAADFTTLFSETDSNASFIDRNLSLAQYAGQTVYIAFHNTSEMGGDVMLIDNLRIGEPLPPSVTIAGSSYVFAGEPTTFTATSGTATSFAWTVDGTAQTETSNTLTYTFNATGAHTVSVVASNAAGNSQPATMDVTVVVCDPISSLPWLADFEDTTANYSCWTIINANNDNYSWIPAYGAFQSQNPEEEDIPYGYESQGAMFSFSYYNSAIRPNDYLVTPAITIPETGNYSLSWYARGIDPEYAEEHYSVYISTSTSIESFGQPVFSETTTSEWNQHIVSLADYAGQNIHIAFRHHDCYDMYMLAIDNIRVGVAGTEGIDDVNGIAISIYPNPTSGMLTVEGEGIRQVELIDINGRIMLQRANASNIDISNMESGVYMLRVTTDAGVRTEKIVKK